MSTELMELGARQVIAGLQCMNTAAEGGTVPAEKVAALVLGLRQAADSLEALVEAAQS